MKGEKKKSKMTSKDAGYDFISWKRKERERKKGQVSNSGDLSGI